MKINRMNTNVTDWETTGQERYIRVEMNRTGMIFDIEETSDGMRIRTPQGLLSIHPEVGNSILIKTARTS